MKYLPLLGVIVLLLSLVSCTNHTERENISSDFTESPTEPSKPDQIVPDLERIKEVYGRIDNSTPKEELIKTEYSLESLQKFTRKGTPFDGYAFALQEIEETFPIECIRKVSEKFYYIIYKVKEGGYLFAHLINPYDEDWTGQNNGLELSHSYYVNGKPDIHKVKKGDSFDKVAARDKSLAGNDFNFISEYSNGDPFYRSVHFESDNLYFITYENAGTIEELRQSKVKSIDKAQSLVITPEEFKELGYSYNYQILDVDK